MTSGARARIGVTLGLLLAVGAVYAPVVGHEFKNYDDAPYILGDSGVRLGLSTEGLRWAFTSTESGNWFPSTRISWLLDQQLHGLSSAGTHATNLVLHALNAALLFLALCALTGRWAPSAAAAGLWALHPLCVESVAWAIERKGLLAGTCFLGALWAHAALANPVRRNLVVCLLLALGLMAKSVLVTLPFVLLLLDRWPLRRLGPDAASRRACWVEKLPQLGIVAVAAVVTLLAQSGAGATRDLEVLPFAERMANAAVAYARYAGKVLWPVDLAVFYPHPRGGTPLLSLLGALLLQLLAAGVIRRFASQGQLLVGWCWFLGMLVPMIGLVQVGGQSMADRYAYLPMIGLLVAGVWSGAALLAPRPRVAIGLSIALLLALGSMTRVQLAHWRDSHALFQHALEVTERNHIAHVMLAQALIAEGDTREAIPHLRATLALDRTNVDALNNLAWLLTTDPAATAAQHREAVALARRADAASPDDPSVLDTLGVALRNAGAAAEARATFTRALALARERGDDALLRALESRLR